MNAMSKVKIELNSAGINELLHSPEIRAALIEAGDKVATRAGTDYEAVSFEMPSRSVVRVSPATRKAAIDNSDNNTLLRALGG